MTVGDDILRGSGMRQRIGYAPGVYDMFHIGHLNILRHAKSQCDHLIAGVVSDEMSELAKGRPPIVPQAERLEIVRHISYVDEAILEVLPDKVETWRTTPFDMIFKGDDWRGTLKGQRARAGVRRGRRRGRLLPLHRAHVQHAAAARTVLGVGRAGARSGQRAIGVTARPHGPRRHSIGCGQTRSNRMLPSQVRCPLPATRCSLKGHKVHTTGAIMRSSCLPADYFGLHLFGRTSRSHPSRPSGEHVLPSGPDHSHSAGKDTSWR